MLSFPNIDPIALQLGPLAIRWYALAYLAGIVGGFYYLKALNGRFFVTKNHSPPEGGESVKETAWEAVSSSNPLKRERKRNVSTSAPPPNHPRPKGLDSSTPPQGGSGTACGGWPFFTPKALDDLILYAVLGIIAGGRLGYVFFYNADYFLSHPSEIPQIWQGGMSFHGGMIGVAVAFFLFARRYKLSYFSLMDRIAAAAPIGLFFGRIANFINGELYGRIATDAAPLAMVFPHAGPEPRHPSQLYEAGLEGLVLFLILALFIYKKHALNYAGRVAGLFLLGYGASRFAIEFFREPDAHLGLFFFDLSMGQLLSLPMIGLGGWLVMRSRAKENKGTVIL